VKFGEQGFAPRPGADPPRPAGGGNVLSGRAAAHRRQYNRIHTPPQRARRAAVDPARAVVARAAIAAILYGALGAAAGLGRWLYVLPRVRLSCSRRQLVVNAKSLVWLVAIFRLAGEGLYRFDAIEMEIVAGKRALGVADPISIDAHSPGFDRLGRGGCVGGQESRGCELLFLHSLHLLQIEVWGVAPVNPGNRPGPFAAYARNFFS
jgi:uncharacterized MAPEG superfamily protein